jgi:hypothetical protein
MVDINIQLEMYVERERYTVLPGIVYVGAYYLNILVTCFVAGPFVTGCAFAFFKILAEFRDLGTLLSFGITSFSYRSHAINLYYKILFIFQDLTMFNIIICNTKGMQGTSTLCSL